ncbi:hypothetical protein PanWU01x14_320360 [Parasponia andersonii]|uniref:Uncharacterized protein n=1 Tax=Parasponia andersonii TaxID=3476 RepID=A0A2P5ALM6_PARAD|nr:hypothetical protein PanWU01x14_320360 [Parasponia andersonii]
MSKTRGQKKFVRDHKEPKEHLMDRACWHRGGPKASLSHSNEAGLLGPDADPCKAHENYPRRAHAGSTGDPPEQFSRRTPGETAAANPARRSAFSSGAPSTPRSSPCTCPRATSPGP